MTQTQKLDRWQGLKDWLDMLGVGLWIIGILGVIVWLVKRIGG
jgi:preprotein translocase subunit Sss1